MVPQQSLNHFLPGFGERGASYGADRHRRKQCSLHVQILRFALLTVSGWRRRPFDRPGQKLDSSREVSEMLTPVLIILLVLLLVGAFPAYPYSRGWGYYPSSALGVVLVVLLVLLLLGLV
jgi:hypothetical protein